MGPIFSVADHSFAAAQHELMTAFPGARVERLGPDLGCLRADGAGIAEVARAGRHGSVIFVRHLMAESARLSLAEAAGDGVAEAAVAMLAGSPVAAEIALQVWASGDPKPAPRPGELWHQVAGRLRHAGWPVSRANQQQVLSACITPHGVVLGLNQRADALADWPGGRVALARGPDQISRAELKLEELFQVFPMSFPAGGIALDLGASPGGWTRILRQRGLAVWAVDPAALDPRLAGDPAVRHVRITAGPFLAETGLTFDLVVNDMRMTPMLSCEVMRAASQRLKPNGLAIMTLKLSPHHPLPTAREALAVLARSYDVIFARQLFHNRNEITVVGRRR